MGELDSESPLGRLYNCRVSYNQDLFVLIDDHHNRRGTGKTTLSLQLADAMDRTEEGITAEKCSINPDGLIRNYTEQPLQSALVLDEAEVSASKYEAASSTNKAIRRLVSMGRVKEKYVIINLPNSGELDRDLKALADVWIMVESLGHATVHFLKWQPYQEKPLTPKVQRLQWDDIGDELRPAYEQLADEKLRELDPGAESGGESVSSSTADRDERIRQMYDEGLSQTQIAGIYGITQQRVDQILKSD